MPFIPKPIVISNYITEPYAIFRIATCTLMDIDYLGKLKREQQKKTEMTATTAMSISNISLCKRHNDYLNSEKHQHCTNSH